MTYETAELGHLFNYLQRVKYMNEIRFIDSETIAIRGNAASAWETCGIQDLLNEMFEYRENVFGEYKI